MMEHGAPYHREMASEMRKELEEFGWLEWGPRTRPANFLDLNPIENLWHILKSNIQNQNPIPTNNQVVIDGLRVGWKKLDMTLVNKLIDSVPRRIEVVIKAGSSPTCYSSKSCSMKSV